MSARSYALIQRKPPTLPLRKKFLFTEKVNIFLAFSFIFIQNIKMKGKNTEKSFFLIQNMAMKGKNTEKSFFLK